MSAQQTVQPEDYHYRVSFPSGTKIEVEGGKKVTQGDVLGSVNSRNVSLVELKAAFSTFDQNNLDQLATKLGTEVAKDDCLAAVSTGLRQNKLLSPAQGKLVGVTEMAVAKLESGQEIDIKADFTGQVDKVEKGGLDLVFPAFVFKGGQGCGQPAVGDFFWVGEKEEDVFSLKADVLDSILVWSKPISRAAFFKALSLGVGGMVFVSDQGKEADFVKKATSYCQSQEVKVGVLVFRGLDENSLAQLSKLQGQRTMIRPTEGLLVVAK